MSESYRFREVRKGERDAVIAFASERGCEVKAEALRHHLSLAVEGEAGLIAAALSTEPNSGQALIQIVVADAPLEATTLTELADRCLRKVQAEGIGSIRVESPDRLPTETIWDQTNWLDRIVEVPSQEANAILESHADEAA